MKKGLSMYSSVCIQQSAVNALSHGGIYCLVKVTLSALGKKSPVLMNILLPFTGEGSACYRFNVDMNAGIHPKRDIRGDINQGACRNTVSCLLWSVLCGKSLLGVNTSELLNRPSNYRIVNQQTEGVLEGNSCCLRGGKCVCGWLCDRNTLEWRRASERKRGEKKPSEYVCVWDLSISAVFLIQAVLSGGPLLAEMTTGSILPCRQHEKWMPSPLFLSFLPSSHLSFLHLFSVLIQCSV